jgi:hypothetical protein
VKKALAIALFLVAGLGCTANRWAASLQTPRVAPSPPGSPCSDTRQEKCWVLDRSPISLVWQWLYVCPLGPEHGRLAVDVPEHCP